jgi:hypothetical protein
MSNEIFLPVTNIPRFFFRAIDIGIYSGMLARSRFGMSSTSLPQTVEQSRYCSLERSRSCVAAGHLLLWNCWW